MPTLWLGTNQIRYTVREGKSRKYTYLRFRPDLTLEIVSPTGRGLESLLREREEWILRKYEELTSARRTLNDHSLMFEGRYLRLVFVQTREREGLQPNLEKGEVVYWAHDRSRIGELVRRWFIRETSRYVVARLSALATEVGVRFRSVDVREIRNWAYCTRRGRISVSWQLIALPERLRDYVLLHELVHLSVFSHSRQFYDKLESVCPEYRGLEKELDAIETVSPVSLA